LHIQAHRVGEPGGYIPIILGALSVGLLVSGCTYFAAPQHVRSGVASTLPGVLASVTFAGVLSAVLILAFGS
jgi:hypothetical protein